MSLYDEEGYMAPEWAGNILNKAQEQISGRGGEARKEIVKLTMMLDKLLGTR